MPLTLIWGLLTSRLAGYIGSASAIALAVMLGVTTLKASITEGELRHQVATAESTIHTTATNLDTCKGNLADKVKAIATLDASVAAIRSEADTRTAAASVAVQQARIATAALSKREAAIAAEKPTADMCASTFSALQEPDQ